MHVVIGTTGFDLEPLRAAAASARANVFVAPNFAIGAVLMMRFAAEAARHMAARGDHRAAPRRQARRAVGHRAAHRRADGAATVPIHSVRLPGIVADQEVILGDVGADADHPPRHDRPHELHARRAARRAPGGRAARVARRRARAPARLSAPASLVAVTDHAVERYRQRVRGA